MNSFSIPHSLQTSVLCQQFTNKFSRNVLSKQYQSTEKKKKNYVLQEEAKKICDIYLIQSFLRAKKCLSKSKMKLILNYLHKRFNWENKSCGFSEKDIELFFQFELVLQFRFKYQNWHHSKQTSLHALTC